MPNIRLQLNDSAALAFIRRQPAAAEHAFQGALNDGSALILREMKHYPPPPPASTYVRTRSLGRSWSRRIEPQEAIVGSNANTAPYNRKVQDATVQARTHRGRWQTVQGVVRANEGRIRQMYRNRLRAELG